MLNIINKYVCVSRYMLAVGKNTIYLTEALQLAKNTIMSRMANIIMSNFTEKLFIYYIVN